jgi:Tfp pilus assembly protein FimT
MVLKNRSTLYGIWKVMMARRIDSRSGDYEHGFSLIELVIVGTIGIIVTAIAVPTVMTAVNNYRLRTSVVDLNTLLQQARAQAIRNNATYNILADLSNSRVFVDANRDGLWNSGEPMVMLQRKISLYTGGSAPAISASTLGFTPQNSIATAGFTSRGVPCNGTVPACTTWSGATLTTPVGFVFFLQSTNSSTTNWAAVSISPTGRFRSWSYSSGAWSY